MNTSYKPVPYKVVEKKGPMLAVENNGHRVTRNLSQMKKVSDHWSCSKQLIYEENDLMEDEGFEQKLSTSGTGKNAVVYCTLDFPQQLEHVCSINFGS